MYDYKWIISTSGLAWYKMIRGGNGAGAGHCRHAGKKEGFPDFNITQRLSQ